jgi:hypothetical protein
MPVMWVERSQPDKPRNTMAQIITPAIEWKRFFVEPVNGRFKMKLALLVL